MKITSATLCDFAQTREGLLFISSGNITRIWRDVFPAPLGLTLALSLCGDLGAATHSGTLAIRLRAMDGSTDREIGGGGLTFESKDPDQPAIFEVILPLHDIAVPKPGVYEIIIAFDGTEQAHLPFGAADVEDKPS